MDLFIFDVWWMTYNISLALCAVFFGRLMVQIKPRIGKLFFGFLWLLFVPNTLYMLTDIFHLWDDWYKAPVFFDLLLIPVYFALLVIGVITFLKALKPFSYALKKHKQTKKYAPFIIFLFNFVIAFGIILGRFQRTNSWEVFTNLPKVIHDITTLFLSSGMIGYIVLMGVIGNVLYFLYTSKKLRFLKI